MELNLLKSIAEAVVVGVRQQIIEKGFHRWELKKYKSTYEAPNPSILTIQVLLQKLLFSGADKLNLKSFQYDPQSSALQFEMCLPQLLFQSGNSFFLMKLCGQDLNSKLNGQITMNNLCISCKTIIIMNERGIKTENWDIKVAVESIKCNMHFTVLNMDLSETANNFLSVILLEFINSLGDKTTELLGPILAQLAQVQRNSEIMNMF